MIDLEYINISISALNLFLILIIAFKVKDMNERLGLLRKETLQLWLGLSKERKEKKPVCPKCGKVIEDHTLKEALECGLIKEGSRDVVGQEENG